jgi:spermidine synthase
VTLLAAIFSLSGASALVFQIAWLRLLALVVGVTVHAASAVLASFMGGLALGSWLGGRLADRVRHPLLVFGLVELGIAASALAVPYALDTVQQIYAALHSDAPHAAALTAARLICAGAVLLVPTTLMGASLPLLARHVRGGTAAEPAAAARIGVLYAANTAGGIAGTLLAGFWLIGSIGVAATTRYAAAANVLAGTLAIARWWTSAQRTTASAPGPSATTSNAEASHRPRATAVQRAALVALAVAGFAGLALEVVWFRLLVLFLPATTYAFTTMLATVLLGIAVGSAVASWRVRRSPDQAFALAWIQVWTGVAAVLSMAALAYTYRRGWRTSGMTQACVVAMLPAATLMGATFPFALAVWLRGAVQGVGAQVGRLYAVNVCGAVAGAVAGGFVLLPLFGTRGSLLTLAAAYVASGVMVAAIADGVRARKTIVVAGAAFAVSVIVLPDLYGAVLARRYPRGEEARFHEEGVQTTVTVHETESGQKTMYLDGLHQANDSAPMVRLHLEIGQLPMALHPRPRRALAIGLGGGVTAGAIAAHPTTLVDVVELSSSVVNGARFFAHVNGGVLDRPNLRLRVGDGRNHLLLTADRYDVVTADVIQPIHAGAGNLYSIEYFGLTRRVLRDGGLAMQWIGHRDELHYKLIMRTFLQAYPHATLWAGGGLMIGSAAPLQISRGAFARKLEDPAARAALARAGFDSFDALLRRYSAGPEEMRAFVGDGPLLTDDRPLLEYHRSLRDSGPPVDLSSLRGDVNRHVVQ